jgi:hypothetical protein
MFVAEEKHECDGIIKFVHLLEVGDLIEVADVYYGEVLDTISDTLGVVSRRRRSGKAQY